MPLRVPPEPLERVEGPALAAEDVDDEVEVVEQNPFRLVGAFGERRPLRELFLQRLANRIGNRRDLPWIATGADHEVISEAAGFPQVEHDDVLGLLVECGANRGGDRLRQFRRS